MESVHCFTCYSFPSKNVKFFVSNCMHIFCEKCKLNCDPDDLNPSKCTECRKTNIRLLKIEPGMPEQVKQMFTPIPQDFQKIMTDMKRVLTFQNKQRASLIAGLSKKEANFDKLRMAHNEEKKKKELYRKELEKVRERVRRQEEELAELRILAEKRASSRTSITPPSQMRIFSDSMYKTPQTPKNEIPEFLRSKTAQPPKNPMDMFKTPNCPPKTSLGFCTPANPPNMFPHITKFAPNTKKHGSQ